MEQLTPSQLANMLDADESFALVDTRQPESYEAWHVRGAENVPFDPSEGVTDDHLERVEALADGREVVTICGKGLTSTPFGFELERRGVDDVSVVKGGMEDWGTVYDVVPIETESDDLVVVQLQRRGKGCLGYVVGSRRAAEAAVIDLTRQTDEFAVAAAEAGLVIEHVLDTHVHADHVSGGASLASDRGVPYHLGERATDRDIVYDYAPVADGETLTVGDVEIEALHTPGHTTEMVSYLVDGALLLTGDTLFLESVGRTELQFGESEARDASDRTNGDTVSDEDAERGAELLYESLHDTVLELPDETRVLPGHVTVTPDGRFEVGAPGEPIAATLATLREELDLLGLDEAAFVDRLTENTPEKPANYERVVELNTGNADLEDDSEATELEMGPNNCAA